MKIASTIRPAGSQQELVFQYKKGQDLAGLDELLEAGSIDSYRQTKDSVIVDINQATDRAAVSKALETPAAIPLLEKAKQLFIPPDMSESVAPEYLKFRGWSLAGAVLGGALGFLNTQINLRATNASFSSVESAALAGTISGYLGTASAMGASYLAKRGDADPKRAFATASLMQTANTVGLMAGLTILPTRFVPISFSSVIVGSVAGAIGSSAGINIGNHIAKYQATKLAKMLVAYDFDRQLNPFVELGGFLFTFIGDGAPGTGKTILIQMIAGLINDYCQVAGYPFHYENFGVDQISSYQGKSGQNCKEFVNTIVNPKAIGFGTVDDIDQVAAKRSDDRASAGQHEVTAVLMESFAGATTVVRGNCSFGMFSNYPENVDDALRQRAGARWLVDGPQTEDDYVDIFVLLAGKNHSIPLGDHELFAAQAIKKAVTAAYEGHDRPKEDRLIAVYERFMEERGEPKTMADVGDYLHRIKLAEPRFTGRAIKNITDAIKMRAMDIDLPDEWFETPEAFMHKSYDDKKAMIEELRGPFSMAMVMQEINRYADSEFRYTDKSDQAAVDQMIRNERLRERAAKEIMELKSKGLWNGA